MTRHYALYFGSGIPYHLGWNVRILIRIGRVALIRYLA